MSCRGFEPATSTRRPTNAVKCQTGCSAGAPQRRTEPTCGDIWRHTRATVTCVNGMRRHVATPASTTTSSLLTSWFGGSSPWQGSSKSVDWLARCCGWWDRQHTRTRPTTTHAHYRQPRVTSPIHLSERFTGHPVDLPRSTGRTGRTITTPFHPARTGLSHFSPTNQPPAAPSASATTARDHKRPAELGKHPGRRSWKEWS